MDMLRCFREVSGISTFLEILHEGGHTSIRSSENGLGDAIGSHRLGEGNAISLQGSLEGPVRNIPGALKPASSLVVRHHSMKGAQPCLSFDQGLPGFTFVLEHLGFAFLEHRLIIGKSTEQPQTLGAFLRRHTGLNGIECLLSIAQNAIQASEMP